jgi:uncharacterized UPF0160 family protein
MIFQKKKTIVTHSSHFHPDDVCAVAVIHMILGGKYRLIRTRNMEIAQKADFLLDFGGEHDPMRQRFDHHQQGGAGVRENGAPYASFGLVWKEYGERLCGSLSIAQSIDENIVAPLDASDNGIDFPENKDGVAPYLFGDFLHSLNPVWSEDENSRDERFKVAVTYAVTMISRAIDREKKNEKGREFTEAIYQSSPDKKIIILETGYPWRKVLLSHPEPLFVIYPNTQDKTWSAKAVPLGEGFKNRISFPASWAGKRDSDLAKVSGVSDATFCHNALFLAVAKSREGAIALAKKALQA